MRMHLTLFLVLLNSFFLEEARGAESIIGCAVGGTAKVARPEEFCQPYAKLLKAFPGDREVSVRNTLCKAHFTNSLNTIREVCALAKNRPDETARKAELDAIQKKLAASIGVKFAGRVQETRMAWEAQKLAVKDSEDLYEKLHAKSRAFRTSHGAYLEGQHAFLQATGSNRLLAESGGAVGQCGVPDANNVLQVSMAYLLHSADALKFGILMRGLFELKLKEVASVAAEAEGKADELKANGVRLGDSSAWTVPKPPKQTEASLLFAKDVKSFQGAATTGAKHVLMEAAVILALEEVAAVEQMLKKLLGPHAHHASHVGG